MGKIQDGVKLVSGMGWGAKGEMKNEDAITVVGRDAGGALESLESFMAPNVARLPTSRRFRIPSHQFTFTSFSIDAIDVVIDHIYRTSVAVYERESSSKERTLENN